jgi:hypothetical protein
MTIFQTAKSSSRHHRTVATAAADAHKEVCSHVSARLAEGTLWSSIVRATISTGQLLVGARPAHFATASTSVASAASREVQTVTRNAGRPELSGSRAYTNDSMAPARGMNHLRALLEVVEVRLRHVKQTRSCKTHSSQMLDSVGAGRMHPAQRMASHNAATSAEPGCNLCSQAHRLLLAVA